MAKLKATVKPKPPQILIGLIIGWSVAIAPAFSQPKITVSYKYYQIYGKTLREIRQSINVNTPIFSKGKKFTGYTNWYVKWRYFYNRSAQGCQIDPSRIDVSTEVTFTMPQWQNRDRADPQIASRWQKFYNALQEHENGHKQHGVMASNAIFQTLRQFPSYPSCPQLETAANAAGKAIIDRYGAADQEYDRQTNHGSTQGATF